jgi:hypothetical protein
MKIQLTVCRIIGAFLVFSASTVQVFAQSDQNEKESIVSFRNDVLPIFSKVGCNSGACHGALAGKGGFRLSLHGYDPVSDQFNIARQDRGRRIELADVGRSLLLTKPTGTIPHKGGAVFAVNSEEYNTIAKWLLQGAAAPTGKDAQVVRVEVDPATASSETGKSIQVKAIAHFDDGTQRDVTKWARYSSSNEVVTQIDQDGKATVTGYGESAITAWYSSKIGIGRVASPYPNEIENVIHENARSLETNFIDELVNKKLRELKLAPSPPADDRAFVRRVFLDSIGCLPTPKEVQSFLDDDRPDKRDALIDSLLSRSEYTDYWTYQWADVFLINGALLRPKAVEAYYKWLRENVESNTPWDKLVRQVLTAKGGSITNGATNFYALHQDPENMAENASQAFMGLSLACAKCHNHPLEKWTNDQYYAFANHFSRVRAKGWGGDARNGDGVRTLFLSSEGELIQPIRGKPQPPTPLDGDPIGFDYEGDRREPLAEWMTSPENPYFARSITNRVWARLMGVGLVEDIDDMRITNPASNEELLVRLAQYLSENNFDLKKLTRLILQSSTYQRSSEAIPENAQETRYYSRYYPRRLMAEVLLDAVSQVTEVPTEFSEVTFRGADNQKTEFYPKGTRAIQLYDSAVKSYFLKAFGRNAREITCECQRTDEPSMVQVLHISNGDTVNKKLESKEGRISKLLSEEISNQSIIEEAYTVTLGRLPADAEREKFLKIFEDNQQTEKRLLVEDLFWSLLSSREFLFNH